MQKISQNQKGFTHLILLLVGVITISGIGASSVLVVKRHNNSERQKTAAAQQAQLLADKNKAAAAATKAAQQPAAAAASTTPATPTTPCTPDTTMYVSTADGLNLRQEKSLSSAKVVLMPYRAALTAGCLDGDWYTATYNGHTGYANKAYVSTTKPAVASSSSSSVSASATPATPATIPSTITISGKVISCANVPSGTFMANASPTTSYSSPNGSAKSSYPKYTVLTGLSCASTEGWLVKNGNEFFSSQDISLTA
jgi:type II secretory pathway pseudopilin PulG